MTKILLGIPTYDGGKYCRDLLIKNLQTITQEVSFLFVTNSGEEDKKDLEEKTKELKHVTVLVAEQQQNNKEQIVHNRNVLREYFLQHDFDYLYFVDHDVLQPKNALEALLMHKKALVTGWYINQFSYNGKKHVLPMAYIADSPGRSRQLAMVDVLKPRFFPITCAGLGCTLIHKDILEKIPFAVGQGTEDAVFYETVRQELNEQLWLDTRAACIHVKFPPGDKRNNIYDPRRYCLK